MQLLYLACQAPGRGLFLHRGITRPESDIKKFSLNLNLLFYHKTYQISFY